MPWKKTKNPDGTSKKKEADEGKVDQLPLVTSTENTDSATPTGDNESKSENNSGVGGSNTKSVSQTPKRHITTVNINAFDDTDSYLHELQPHLFRPSPSKQHPVISYEKNKSVRILVKEPISEPLKQNSRSKDSETNNLFWKDSLNKKSADINCWVENHSKENAESKTISLSPEKLKDEEGGVKVRPLLDVSWKGSSHTSVLDEPPSSDDCQRSTSTLVNSNVSKIGKSTEFQRGFVSICCGISIVVGSATCLRLPELLFTYGVGSFLLAFFVCLFVVAIPLAYLECGLAQFSNNSVIGVWSLVPLSRGIGWSTVVGCLYWGATSAGIASPWFHYIIAQNNPELLQVPKICRLLNGTDFDAVAYYSHCVYNLSSSWDAGPDLTLTWSLPAGLITILMVASLSVTGGPGLLALVSATGSLLALLGYGSLLYVSISALTQHEKYGHTNMKQLFSPFIPDFEILLFPQVWLAAMSQTFLSLGPGVGMLLNHSANNVFRHPLRRHLWFLTTLTVVTTIIVSLTTVLEAKIFASQSLSSSTSPKYEIDPMTREAFLTSSVGPDYQFLSINFSGYEERISASDNCILLTSRFTDLSCTRTAPGLVKGVPFIISSYITTFAMGHLIPWVSSILKNLIFLGFLGAAVATSCVCMHVGVVAAREARSLPPAVAALVLMAVLSLVAAPMSTQAGAAFIYLVDNFVLMPGLLWPSIAMLIALTTCHGVAKIRKDLTFMLESNVSYFWLPIWAGVIPIILIGITLWTFIIDWRELGLIGRPDWCVSFVWSLRVGLLISMPVTAIIVINSQLAYGFKDKVLSSLQSSREWGDWGPQDPIEHHHWRRWREDETQSYASLERRLASKSRPLTYTHSTLSSSSSSTLGRLRAKYRGQSKPYDL